MANENAADVDSGVASSEVTPVNQESSSLVSPSEEASDLEQVTTPGAALSKREEKAEKLVKEFAVSSKEPEDDDLDDIEESLAERLIGLTEMLPNCVINASCSTVSNSASFVKGSYNVLRHVTWFCATTALLLVAPVVFESERANTLEAMKQDRNRLMLGPGTAVSGGLPGNFMAPPPMMQ